MLAVIFKWPATRLVTGRKPKNETAHTRPGRAARLPMSHLRLPTASETDWNADCCSYN